MPDYDILLNNLRGQVRTFISLAESFNGTLVDYSEVMEPEEFAELVDVLFAEILDTLDFPRLLTATLGECDQCDQPHAVDEDEIKAFVGGHVETARDVIMFLFRDALSDEYLVLCSDRLDSIKARIEDKLFGVKSEESADELVPEEPREEPHQEACISNVVDLWRKHG